MTCWVTQPTNGAATLSPCPAPLPPRSAAPPPPEGHPQAQRRCLQSPRGRQAEALTTASLAERPALGLQGQGKKGFDS